MAKWVMETIVAAGHIGIVALMFLENVFPPIPSEVIMPLAGYLASDGRLPLAGVIAAGTLGSVLGALPLYYAGRRFGLERAARFAERRGRWLTLSRASIEHASDWFDRHGAVAVLAGRLVPGVRSLISIPAGINRMPLPLFLLLTTLGSAAWTSLLALLGFWLGRNFAAVERALDPASWAVLAAVLAIYLYRVIRHRGAAR